MSSMLEGLNEAQVRAVTHEKGPLLIVAGAGTGKTTVLARRYAWLLQSKSAEYRVPSSGSLLGTRHSALGTRHSALGTENILTLTFTEKAAGEMEDRVLQLLPNGTYDFWISTFHAFCQRVLESHALEIGLPDRFRIVNGTDAWLMLKRKIQELPLDHYRPLGNPVKFLNGLLTHISRAKDEGVTAERYLEFAQSAALDGDAEFVAGERKRLQELADCYFAYRRLLREEGCLDFGDVIVETLRLLQTRPAVLQTLQEQFRVIMVDEFQDTNWAQYELIKLLAGHEKNITVVGDDDQAIYKFRGASLANILQFRDDFPESKTVALTENYRSRQEILDIAYAFICKNNPYRLEVKLADTGLSKALVAGRGKGGRVGAEWYRSLEEETESVVAAIKKLKEDDITLTWNDIAILVRSNDTAIPFVAALDRHGVPFRFYALRGLYGKPEVVDIRALLTLCVATQDSTVVWRAMSVDCFGFTAQDVSAFLHHANRKSLTLWQSLQHAPVIPDLPPEAVMRAQKFTGCIEALAETGRRERPLAVLQFVLDKTGYLAAILKRPEGEKIDALNVLNGFADRIKRYEASTLAPTVNEFLNELTFEIESGEEGALDVDPSAGPDMVKIMTVHASKGLEFRHVFVVSMVDQRFPTRARQDAIPLPEGLVNERLPEGDAHLEEERRLLYVAMTRAKDTLTLTGASSYGGTRQKKPSVFLGEAGVPVKEVKLAAGDVLSLTPSDVIQATSDEKEMYPLKRRFSFTQLAAFRKCPLQYKFAHVYRIPILGSFHKSFGQTIHLTFHDILQRHVDRGNASQGDLFSPSQSVSPYAPTGFRVPLDEALTIYGERWNGNDLWYPDRKTYDAYRSEGCAAVKRIWEVWNILPPRIKSLEQRFDWKIGEHSLKGSIDRIDELEDGGVAIYDYKTGEPKTADDLETGDKEQLRIYQLAMEQRGLSVKKLAYIYVRDGKEAPVDLIQGEKRSGFIDDLRSRMDAILGSRFPAQPSVSNCKHCDFRNICESRKV